MIINSNSYAENLFGYDKKDMFQKNINLILPTFLKNHCKIFRKEYLSKFGKSKNMISFVTPVNKDGYIFPVIQKVQYFKNKVNNIEYFIANYYVLEEAN